MHSRAPSSSQVPTAASLAALEAELAEKQAQVGRARDLVRRFGKDERAQVRARLQEDLQRHERAIEEARTRRRDLQSQVVDHEVELRDLVEQENALAEHLHRLTCQKHLDLVRYADIELGQMRDNRANLERLIRARHAQLLAIRCEISGRDRASVDDMRYLLQKADSLQRELLNDGATEAVADLLKPSSDGTSPATRILEAALAKRRLEMDRARMDRDEAQRRLTEQRRALAAQTRSLLERKQRHTLLAARGVDVLEAIELGDAPPTPFVLANATDDDDRPPEPAIEPVQEMVARVQERLVEGRRLLVERRARLATDSARVGRVGADDMGPGSYPDWQVPIYWSMRAIVDNVVVPRAMGQIAAMLPVDEGELEERQRQWARACMEIDAQASEHERKRALVLVWEGLLRDGVDSLLRQIADHVCKARDDVSALVKDVIIGGLIGQATDDVSRAYDVVVDLHADGRRRGRRRFRHGNVVTRADVFEAKRDAERGAHDRRRTLLGRLRARPDASKNQKRRRKVVAVDGPVDDATERKEIDEDEGVVVVDVDGFAGQPPTGSFEEAYCKAWHAALTTVHGQAGGYVAVRGDASGRFVLGAGTDGSLEVAEVATGHTHRQLPGIGHSRRWKLMASGPWSRLLSAATATTKGTVALWDVAVGEPGASSVAPRVPRRVDEISFVDLVSKKPDPPKRNMSDEVASAFVVIDPPHPVPSAIAVHRAVTFNLDTPSVVVGMDNGDLVRWNTSNATAQMLTGRSAASREPGPVSAPGGGFVRREFHHGHRSSICMMDFLADTDLVSADKDGYVIVWRTDRLSGFDWFQPRRRFHVSVAETYFDDDRSRPAQQLFPPAGVPIDLLNGAAYEDALRRRLVTAGYRSWRSRSPDTLYPQAGDGECWTHAFRRDQGRLIAHERRPVRCRQRRASLIGAQMTPTGTDLVILSWFPKDTVGNRASRASFHVGSIDGKAQDSEERFRHVADIAVADDLESATGAQIAVWRISNVFDPPGTDFIFVLTVVSPTFVSVISLSTGATVMKIALPGSSQGRTPSDLAVFSGSHSIAVCYATSRAIDTWTIEDRNDEEHRRQYTLRMRLQSQRLQAAPVEQRVRVSSTEWGFGYVDFDVPNTRFDAQAKLRELVKTLVDHAVMGTRWVPPEQPIRPQPGTDDVKDADEEGATEDETPDAVPADVPSNQATKQPSPKARAKGWRPWRSGTPR